MNENITMGYVAPAEDELTVVNPNPAIVTTGYVAPAEDELTVVNPNPAIVTTATTEDEPNEMLVGIVVGCTRLNVRKAPDKGAKVVATVPAGTELLIDGDQLDDEYYSVCTASGIEGFCMKQFIEIQE